MTIAITTPFLPYERVYSDAAAAAVRRCFPEQPEPVLQRQDGAPLRKSTDNNPFPMAIFKVGRQIVCATLRADAASFTVEWITKDEHNRKSVRARKSTVESFFAAFDKHWPLGPSLENYMSYLQRAAVAQVPALRTSKNNDDLIEFRRIQQALQVDAFRLKPGDHVLVRKQGLTGELLRGRFIRFETLKLNTGADETMELRGAIVKLKDGTKARVAPLMMLQKYRPPVKYKAVQAMWQGLPYDSLLIAELSDGTYRVRPVEGGDDWITDEIRPMRRKKANPAPIADKSTNVENRTVA